jgi:hypothetical protein
MSGDQFVLLSVMSSNSYSYRCAQVSLFFVLLWFSFFFFFFLLFFRALWRRKVNSRCCSCSYCTVGTVGCFVLVLVFFFCSGVVFWFWCYAFVLVAVFGPGVMSVLMLYLILVLCPF